MAEHPRPPCPVCGRPIRTNNLARHLRTHELDAAERMQIEPELQAQIIRLYRSGKSYATIGREAFVGPTTVRRVLLANGVQPRQPGPSRIPAKLSADEQLKRTMLYGRGYSIHEVAAMCGVSYTAVRATLARAGTQLRPSGPNLRWQRRRRSTPKEAA